MKKPQMNVMDPQNIRADIRNGFIVDQTSGMAPGFAQGNLVVLPKVWATDFLQFCMANPKPCPLLALGNPGDPSLPGAGAGIDIRTDLPRYRIFRDGALVDELTDIRALWQDDFVTFLIGCSFSFEGALMDAGIGVRHIELGTNVPMYRTNIKCQSAGPFKGHYVVSMRPFSPANAIRAIEITATMPQVHGAPVHFGDPSAIGISDLSSPDFGDSVPVRDGEVPVFWACGVTPQVALEQARPPIAITHSPGYMLITDISEQDLRSGQFKFQKPHW
ncbi:MULTISPECIES: putative hydro-lyase [Agrobacterium]|uniref:putative hydro-lyase n=1 Tax=Agrobacterium TaxID=357 RepID=UPI003FA55DEF